MHRVVSRLAQVTQQSQDLSPSNLAPQHTILGVIFVSNGLALNLKSHGMTLPPSPPQDGPGWPVMGMKEEPSFPSQGMGGDDGDEPSPDTLVRAPGTPWGLSQYLLARLPGWHQGSQRRREKGFPEGRQEVTNETDWEGQTQEWSR